MESCGGSGDGKEKTPWTTSSMIENRGKWNLGADIEVLRHLKNFSDNIFSQVKATSEALDSLETDLNTTCVGVHIVSNRFLALADCQFVENRVYDDEEPAQEDNKVSSDSVNRTKEEEETERFTKRKQAILNGLEVLRTKFEPVHVLSVDSEEEDEVDDDGTPAGVVYKPINPFDNKPLPHLIGSKEFMIDPYVGLKDYLSEDEEEEEDDDDDDDDDDEQQASLDDSSGSKAISAHEDSEPESDRAPVEPAVSSEVKQISDFEKKGLSFAEHLAARLEGMKFDRNLDATTDESLPPAAPIKISTTIESPYETIERPYDTKADRFYDNGFDDRYDDYDDSIFGRNSNNPIQDNDFEEEDLFLPNEEKSRTTSKSDQPLNPTKQNLIKDLENKLKKDLNRLAPSTSNNSDIAASSPSYTKTMNPSSSSNDLFSDNINEEEEDSLFAASKPIKKNKIGADVDPFRNDSKPERDLTKRLEIQKKPDLNSIKSNNTIKFDDVDDFDDDEDSIFSSTVEKSSKNGSTKLSDSFYDDTSSIKSNKSSSLFERDAVPPLPSSTKAIDDLFKDVDQDNDDDDDLFSSYFTKNKSNKTSKSQSDGLFSTNTKPKTVVDDLFGDFKDDLFSDVKQSSKITNSSTSKGNSSKNKVPSLFSDSDSDSEFISSKKSNVGSSIEVEAKIPTVVSSKSTDSPKQQLFSKSVSNTDNDNLFNSSSLKSSNPDSMTSKNNSKLSLSNDFPDSSSKVRVESDEDLFGAIDSVQSKQKTMSTGKDTYVNARNKKPLSLFDDADSDEDDGLFGNSVSIKHSTKPEAIDDDLFSQSSSQSKDEPVSQNNSNNVSENLGKNSESKLSSIEKEKKNSESKLSSIEKETIEPPRKVINKSEVDSSIPSDYTSHKKTVVDDCDDLFGSSTGANIRIESEKPTSYGNKSTNNEVKSNAAKVVNDDALFEDSSTFSEMKSSNASSIGIKPSDAPSIVKPSIDSLFEDVDDNSTDIFSSIGKPGSKSSINNDEKTALSVPSSVITDIKDDYNIDDDDALFNNTTSKVISSESSLGGNLKSISVPIKKGYPSDDDNESFLVGKPHLKKYENYTESGDLIRDNPLLKDVETKITDSQGISSGLPKPSIEAPVESDPLSSLSKPNLSVKPHPPSKPLKPNIEKRSKPSPPKTLNLPAPISMDEPSGNNSAVDSTDGGLLSTEPKVESPKKVTPGKLNLQKTLNIDPRALLPGAQPKFKKSSNENVEQNDASESKVKIFAPEVEQNNALEPKAKISAEVVPKVVSESEAKVSPTGVLSNVNKDRARIQVKRRPQTRKARREAIRHSTFEEDETDNSSSVTTYSIADQTSSSVEPSNILSPSTDEEDLFGVPPLDLPPDYTKVSTSPGDLFTMPTTVLSPGLSFKDNEFPEDVNQSGNQVVEKTHDKLDDKDIFEDIVDPMHSIHGDGLDFNDTLDVNKTGKEFLSNSSSINLFDDDVPVIKPPTFGITNSENKKHSDLHSIQSKLKDEDVDSDLFCNKPVKEESVKKLEEKTVFNKDFLEANTTKPDPLVSGLNLSEEKVTPSSVDEELFSSVPLKNEKIAKREDVSAPSLFPSLKEKQDVAQQEKKNLQSLFSTDDNDDALFQTALISSKTSSRVSTGTSSIDSKVQSSSSKAKVGSDKSSKLDSLFVNDEDDDDLFGSIKQPTRQPTLTKPSSSSGILDSESSAKSKKSIFSDDQDSDIFSASNANFSKENKSAPKTSSATNVTNSRLPVKNRLSKPDTQQPFVDPLSNLDDTQ